MYSHVLVLFFFSFIWNIIAPKEVLQYLKGQSFKTIRVLGLSLNLKKFRGKSPMHSSGQMPHVCMYGPLSITRLHHVSWWLPELRRSAFSSSLTQVCDLSLWGVTSQRAPTSTGQRAPTSTFPSSSHFPEKQSIPGTSPPWIWSYTFSLIRKGVSPDQVISSSQGQWSGLSSCFPNLKVYINHLENFVKKQVLIQWVWEGLRFCISNSLPGGDHHSAGQQTTAGTASL